MIHGPCHEILILSRTDSQFEKEKWRFLWLRMSSLKASEPLWQLKAIRESLKGWLPSHRFQGLSCPKYNSTTVQLGEALSLLGTLYRARARGYLQGYSKQLLHQKCSIEHGDFPIAA